MRNHFSQQKAAKAGQRVVKSDWSGIRRALAWIDTFCLPWRNRILFLAERDKRPIPSVRRWLCYVEKLISCFKHKYRDLSSESYCTRRSRLN